MINKLDNRLPNSDAMQCNGSWEVAEAGRGEEAIFILFESYFCCRVQLEDSMRKGFTICRGVIGSWDCHWETLNREKRDKKKEDLHTWEKSIFEVASYMTIVVNWESIDAIIRHLTRKEDLYCISSSSSCFFSLSFFSSRSAVIDKPTLIILDHQHNI